LRAIRLFTSRIADACAEGRHLHSSGGQAAASDGAAADAGAPPEQVAGSAAPDEREGAPEDALWAEADLRKGPGQDRGSDAAGLEAAPLP
ncbi:MAG: hypothetical protein ACRD1E_13175, partial [Terriglobales bacterium]